ncbi:MAG: M28 family peptidase [Candidatus Thermoplasmatota archaeon]|nr:M28 family peptidase [Candidatus Thermoplasmatota archaeon]
MKNTKYLLIALLLFIASVSAGFIVSCSTSASRGPKPSADTLDDTEVEQSEDVGIQVEETPIEVEKPPLVFEGQKAYEIVKVLSQDIGVRVQGSSEEKLAADAMADMLRGYGCDTVYLQSFPLPDGSISQNVIAVVEGENPAFSIVVGGHIDSRSTTPGANDNASGASTTMELARVFAHNGSYPTLIFILFGSEEDHGEITREHLYSHYGSRHYVASMTYQERERLIGMFSLDMVGYGNGLFARYMGIGPMKLVDMIYAFGNTNGYPLGTMQGGNLSDHEPFEKAGIPSVWMEYMIDGSYDPLVHKSEDTLSHVSPTNLKYTGDLLQRFFESLDLNKCEELKAAKRV